MDRTMLDSDEREQISRGSCPDCLYRGFVIGPMGGRNINIECGNPACRSRFNVAFFSGAAEFGHRIEAGVKWPSEPTTDAPTRQAAGLWSCGHHALGMCAECYHQLARKAADLAAEVERLKDGEP